eukprot:Nitzschia sp. Nitz4//scaffold105_size73764//18376//20088//NITZ4_005672-RA/size73764-processed-gene-0.3-mRNA-1//1//CDS//3329532435//6374//frame0
MASTWVGTARLALHYTAPAFAVGGLVAANHVSKTTGFSSTASGASLPTKCEASSESSSGKKPSSLMYRRRMSRVGRFSLLSETNSNPSIPVLLLSLSGQAWSANDFINLYHDRKIDQRHERFRSILDPQDSNHFLALDVGDEERRPLPVYDMIAYPRIYRSELKSMISDAIFQPFDLNESLWQAWTASGGAIGQSGSVSKVHAEAIAKSDPSAVESFLLFRAHHCLADGVSLATIFGELVDEGEEISKNIETKVAEFKRRKKSFWRRLQIFLYYWCWGSIKAFWYQMWLYWRSLFVSSPWKALKKRAADQGNDSDEDGSYRTISWAQVAPVDEVKQVAEYFSEKTRGKITVNDIFCSCASGAVAKLMRYHRQVHPDLALSLPTMNLVIPVHMQGGVLLPGQSMGNKIGALVSQVPAEDALNARERLLEVHESLWERKRTPAAALSFLVANISGGTIGSLLGSWTPWLFEKAHAKASIVVTNVRGPESMIHLGGRRVETSLGFLPIPPGIPIGMVVMSYNQTMTLTIMAESWAVPDSDLFLSWVVEEYQQLLIEAKANGKSKCLATIATIP